MKGIDEGETGAWLLPGGGALYTDSGSGEESGAGTGGDAPGGSGSEPSEDVRDEGITGGCGFGRAPAESSRWRAGLWTNSQFSSAPPPTLLLLLLLL